MLDWVFFSPFLTARFSRHVFCYLFYYSCTSYPAHRATFLFCVECFTRKLTFLSIKLSERVVLNDKSRRRGREFQMNGRRVSWLVATTNHFTVSSLASLPAPCVTTGIRLLRTFPPMGWNWMSAPRFYVFRVKRKFLDVGCWSNAFNSWTIFFILWWFVCVCFCVLCWKQVIETDTPVKGVWTVVRHLRTYRTHCERQLVNWWCIDTEIREVPRSLMWIHVVG